MKSILIFSILIVAIISCKGPQGEVGPQGIQGNQGIQGIAGKDASKIRFSPWTSFSNWNCTPTCKNRTTNFPLTEEFTDNGLFLVYLESPIPQLLPTSELYLNSGVYFRYFSGTPTSKQSLFITASTTLYDPNDLRAYLSDSFLNIRKFRWVYIPFTSSGRKANINYSDYFAVKKAYNIPD